MYILRSMFIISECSLYISRVHYSEVQLYLQGCLVLDRIPQQAIKSKETMTWGYKQ